jgi:hypothetical protein
MIKSGRSFNASPQLSQLSIIRLVYLFGPNPTETIKTESILITLMEALGIASNRTRTHAPNKNPLFTLGTHTHRPVVGLHGQSWQSIVLSSHAPKSNKTKKARHQRTDDALFNRFIRRSANPGPIFRAKANRRRWCFVMCVVNWKMIGVNVSRRLQGHEH